VSYNEDETPFYMDPSKDTGWHASTCQCPSCMNHCKVHKFHDVEEFFKDPECKHGVSNLGGQPCYNCVIEENEHLEAENMVLREELAKELEHEKNLQQERFDTARLSVCPSCGFDNLPSESERARHLEAEIEILKDAMMAELPDDPDRPDTAKAYAEEFLGCADSWERTYRMILDKKDAAMAESLSNFKKWRETADKLIAEMDKREKAESETAHLREQFDKAMHIHQEDLKALKEQDDELAALKSGKCVCGAQKQE